MSKFGKSGCRWKNKDSNYKVGSKGKEALQKIHEGSEIFMNFKKYAQQLDKRHDKFERLVKLSRDITIESKRIIFLLHTIDRESKRTLILNEAESRLKALMFSHWKSIAKELQNEDPYLYHRAFSPGMQEFMEALVFCNYLRGEKFQHWDHYQKELKYTDPPSDASCTENCNSIHVVLVPADYILGLADVTGELMRKCINNLGEGDVQGCYRTCDLVRNLYSGFLTIGLFGNKEMTHKVFILRQSLLKMEMVCYNIHVRGSEIPKYMLADVDGPKAYADEDEGFFG